MSTAKLAHLTDRGVMRIAGSDAVTLLDGLVTNSLGSLDTHAAIHTGLLSPQGKILFDFFIVPEGDGLLVETERSQIQGLTQRLTFYRLRADVTFEDLSDALAIVAAWDQPAGPPGGIIAFSDPRHPDLGQRLILPIARLPELAGERFDAEAYHAHRIAVGVPEVSHDYPLGDTFPHEALYDQLASVDFRKGCYIGQEVVSRMQHRGTARKRIVPVTGDNNLTASAEIAAGDASVGKIGSVAGSRGLALVRLDRAHEAVAKGIVLTANGVPISVDKPAWLELDMATGKAVASS